MIFWLACLASAVTFCVHTFVGGRFVARPLLVDTNLPKASKWLNYYCWHVTTVLLAWLALVFALLALGVVATRVSFWAGMLCLLAAACSVLSVWVALRGCIHPLRFPSTSLFAIIAALSGWAATGV